jgi:hypothetical protein
MRAHRSATAAMYASVPGGAFHRGTQSVVVGYLAARQDDGLHLDPSASRLKFVLVMNGCVR